MVDGPRADALIAGIVNERLNRRSLLKRAAVLGLSVPAVAGLLAACGGDEDEPAADEPADDQDATPPSTGADPTEESGDGADDETPRQMAKHLPLPMKPPRLMSR
jgi:hypothetical protein